MIQLKIKKINMKVVALHYAELPTSWWDKTVYFQHAGAHYFFSIYCCDSKHYFCENIYSFFHSENLAWQDTWHKLKEAIRKFEYNNNGVILYQIKEEEVFAALEYKFNNPHLGEKIEANYVAFYDEFQVQIKSGNANIPPTATVLARFIPSELSNMKKLINKITYIPF